MECHHCGEALPKRKRGQRQRFCTPRCRVAASRVKSLCVPETETAPQTEIIPSVHKTGLLTTSTAFPLAICPGWQVAFDQLQWVLQHWRTPQWRDRAFCRTRAGLERSIRELIGRGHQAAVVHLPDWHPDVARVPEPKQTLIEVVSSPELRVREDRPINDFISGPTLGALQGDDVQLEYYADGYPKIPDCLRRGGYFREAAE